MRIGNFFRYFGSMFFGFSSPTKGMITMQEIAMIGIAFCLYGIGEIMNKLKL